MAKLASRKRLTITCFIASVILSILFGAVLGFMHFSSVAVPHANCLASIPQTPPPTAIRGVAVNILTEPPSNPAQLVNVLLNFAAVLPAAWPIQLFTSVRSHAAIAMLPGIVRLVNAGRMRLTPLAPLLDGRGRRELLLSPWLWRRCAADSVLIFDGSSALCGNSPWTPDDFRVAYDWVGAAWKWAKPDSPHAWGGNGALSLRNRTLVLRVLEDALAGQPAEPGDGPESEAERAATAGSASGEAAPYAYARFKGNEDMWYVRKLHALRESAAASTGRVPTNAGTPTATGKGASAAVGAAVRLAPRAASMRWAVEELYDPAASPVPFGVYHTMRSVPDATRAAVLRACPEAKRLFDARHERGPDAPPNHNHSKPLG
jgi:hypothetical protein